MATQTRDRIISVSIKDVNGKTINHSIRAKAVESIGMGGGSINIKYTNGKLGVYNLSNVIYFEIETESVPVLETPNQEEVKQVEAATSESGSTG